MSEEKVSTRGRKQTLTDSERKMNRSEVSSKWNKFRIYVGDQLDRWNELKEVLHMNRFDFLLSWTIILITIVLGLFLSKNRIFCRIPWC
jgi:hypothetical protein